MNTDHNKIRDYLEQKGYEGAELDKAATSTAAKVAAIQCGIGIVQITTHGSIRKGSLSPGNGFRYEVLAVPVEGHLDGEMLGAVTDGTLIVDCFGGRAWLFSPNGVSNFVDVHYIAEKFQLRAEAAHGVAAVIAALLGRGTNSKFKTIL